MTLTRPVHYAPDPRASISPTARHPADSRNPGVAGERGAALESAISRAGEAADARVDRAIRQSSERVRVERDQRKRRGYAGRHPFFREMRDYIKSLDPRAARHPCRRQPAEAQTRRGIRGQRRRLPHDEPVLRRVARSARGARSRARQGDRAVSRQDGDHLGDRFPGNLRQERRPMRTPRAFPSCANSCPMLAKRDWIAGAILWCYQDYKSRRYFWPGQEQGYLEHGIVDENRQRKPSYFAWKELNEPAHIEVRWTQGANGDARRPSRSRSRRTPRRSCRTCR